MNAKLWASVSGVCITTAVVVTTVLGTGGNDPARQKPAGQPVAPASTVVSTVTASPTPVAAAKVAPSKKKAAPVKRRAVVRKPRRAAVVNQEAPVTDPAPNDPPPNDPPQSDPAPVYTPSIDPKAPGLPNMSRPAGQPHPSPSD